MADLSYKFTYAYGGPGSEGDAGVGKHHCKLTLTNTAGLPKEARVASTRELLLRRAFVAERFPDWREHGEAFWRPQPHRRQGGLEVKLASVNNSYGSFMVPYLILNRAV